MGRRWTGVRTVEEGSKLDLRWLLKNQCIIKGYYARGGIELPDGTLIEFESNFTDEEKYFRIIQVLSVHNAKNDYKIDITTIKSNLGTGLIPYFICPITNKRAKILIMSYGYNMYVHREAYGTMIDTKPLYYRVQQVSSSDYHNVRYFSLKNRCDKLFHKLFTSRSLRTHYRGKLSLNMFKLEKLANKKKYHEIERNNLLKEHCKKYSRFTPDN
jgi:hypothetical protein